MDITRSTKDLRDKRLHRCFAVIGWSLLVVYALILIVLLFLGNYRTHGFIRSANLIPFLTINRYITNSDHFSMNILIINLLGNICVFIPLGFIIPCLLKGMRHFFRIVLMGIILIIAVESLQWLLYVGIFDIDDIILNVFGIAIGYGAFKLVNVFLFMIKGGAKKNEFDHCKQSDKII